MISLRKVDPVLTTNNAGEFPLSVVKLLSLLIFPLFCRAAIVLDRVRPFVMSVSFWEGIKNAYFKHLRLLLFSALAAISLILIGVSYYWLEDRKNFWSDLFLNLGPEVLGMAATIGLIDYLISRRDKREHIRSVKPMALALLTTFKSHRAAYDNYMTGSSIPLPEAIERYRDALNASEFIASRFSILVDEQQPELAPKLARYTVMAVNHLATIEQAIAAVRAIAPNAAAHMDRVRSDARLILDLTDEMRSLVVPIYELTTDSDVENH